MRGPFSFAVTEAERRAAASLLASSGCGAHPSSGRGFCTPGPLHGIWAETKGGQGRVVQIA